MPHMRHKDKMTERGILHCPTALPLVRRLSGLVFLFFVLACASCAAIRPTPSQYENKLTVTATAYNTPSARTDRSPKIGAWGDTVAPGVKAIAISPDLRSLGLRRGTKVRIEGLPGEYVVLDMMPDQWKRHIDIYMGEDVKAARTWGRRKVKIWWTNSGSSNVPSKTICSLFFYPGDATPNDSPVSAISRWPEPEVGRAAVARSSRWCTRGSQKDL